MALVEKSSGRTKLLAALTVFREANPEMPDSDKQVLRRLEMDRGAATVFAVLPEQPPHWLLVQTCVQANEILRLFDQEVARSRRLLGSRRQRGNLDHLKKGVARIRAFLKDLRAQPVGRVLAQHSVPAQEMEVMWQGLALLEQTIRGEERIAHETPKRFGATRKTGKGAAELAAIGWIAEGFQKAVGGADWKSAAKLAELVLQCPVSEARIREAYRTRTGRDWRMPLYSPSEMGNAGKIKRVREIQEKARSAAEGQSPRLMTKRR
jgi:hypothetical protein